MLFDAPSPATQRILDGSKRLSSRNGSGDELSTASVTGDKFLTGTLLYDSWMMGLASYQARSPSKGKFTLLGIAVLTASAVPRTEAAVRNHAAPPPARDVLACSAYDRQLQPPPIHISAEQLFLEGPLPVWSGVRGRNSRQVSYTFSWQPAGSHWQRYLLSVHGWRFLPRQQRRL